MPESTATNAASYTTPRDTIAELSAEAYSTSEKVAHDRLKSLLTIPRNPCSRCGEIRAHDRLKYANVSTVAGEASISQCERFSFSR
ncbi:MAG: hypothetical protein E5Y88_29470 [Mesorhizobium sp.]|uniref:hypothetical protein n=1 Tax=Mesorhizobium sp. TaxID=1871066 RepID=UPI00121C189F|nr:hypothetical protein [Mesorhizobium sp.]TIL22094.1 MAG: hypothetical protein E5Y88_29470 [Mesorhizobium sp.]TIQ41650.1 MAG: hypothetical protein E5X49_18460 [Mesorhizobium sp.]TIW61999.1 MAG: hypothetical protein E5V48_06395 [Mesorhizobium sp.]TIW65953.1 MAG: hypothetical protein E5V60_14270 [Mesorhizobium sp.]TJW31411.1 MAG: hypothetical protein E5V49_16620 [Mesorhizobium sp.]